MLLNEFGVSIKYKCKYDSKPINSLLNKEHSEKVFGEPEQKLKMLHY